MADGKRCRKKRIWCKRCLGSFLLPLRYERHLKFCRRPDHVDTVWTMPEEPYNFITFRNKRHQARVPFVIYIDFESVLKPVAENDELHRAGRNTVREQEHIPCAVGIKVVSTLPKNKFNMPYEWISQEGEDEQPSLATKFLVRLLEIEQQLLEVLFDDQNLIWTPENQRTFDSETRCYLCKRDFDDALAVRDQIWQKVRDHDHMTGLYRGAAHGICNLQVRIKLIFIVLINSAYSFNDYSFRKTTKYPSSRTTYATTTGTSWRPHSSMYSAPTTSCPSSGRGLRNTYKYVSFFDSLIVIEIMNFEI